jgi:hypothetical protein
MFALGFEDIEDMPVVLKDIGVEEADAAIADAHGVRLPARRAYSSERAHPSTFFRCRK